MTAAIARLLAKLVEALEPFAEAADDLPSKEDWEAQNKASGVVVSFYAEDNDRLDDWSTDLVVGDLRRASAVLAELSTRLEQKR